MAGGSGSSGMMDTGGNQAMDTSNQIMHSEPVAYEVNVLVITYFVLRYN